MAERDLARLLATLSVTVRAGRYAFVSTPQADARLAAHAQAIVREDEGVTYVVDETQLDADADTAFRAAWLTLAVHSALDAVGLTAAVASALASAGIPCNVIAGLHHDHLLVESARRDDALAALAALQRRHAA
jgi:hypothetical protein